MWLRNKIITTLILVILWDNFWLPLPSAWVFRVLANQPDLRLFGLSKLPTITLCCFKFFQALFNEMYLLRAFQTFFTSNFYFMTQGLSEGCYQSRLPDPYESLRGFWLFRFQSQITWVWLMQPVFFWQDSVFLELRYWLLEVMFAWKFYLRQRDHLVCIRLLWNVSLQPYQIILRPCRWSRILPRALLCYLVLLRNLDFVSCLRGFNLTFGHFEASCQVRGPCIWYEQGPKVWSFLHIRVVARFHFHKDNNEVTIII